MSLDEQLKLDLNIDKINSRLRPAVNLVYYHFNLIFKSFSSLSLLYFEEVDLYTGADIDRDRYLPGPVISGGLQFL